MVRGLVNGVSSIGNVLYLIDFFDFFVLFIDIFDMIINFFMMYF